MPRLAHARVTGDGATPAGWLHVLHGIYGAGRNWRSVARALVERRPDLGAVLVDLRLHGGSRDFPPPHTLEACARDVRELAERDATPVSFLLGHSFGGKVALLLAADPPAALRQVWVVDCTPSAGPPRGSAVEMLRAVRGAPGPFEDREEAIAALEQAGFDRLVATWMASNLESGEGGLWWRFHPDDMKGLLHDFFRTDLWPIVEDPPPGVELRFLKATDSDVVSQEECDRIEAAGRAGASVRLDRVMGGHWLNVDNPAALVDLLASGLLRSG